MVGSTEIDIFEVRRSSKFVCYIFDMLNRACYFRTCLKVKG